MPSHEVFQRTYSVISRHKWRAEQYFNTVYGMAHLVLSFQGINDKNRAVLWHGLLNGRPSLVIFRHKWQEQSRYIGTLYGLPRFMVFLLQRILLLSLQAFYHRKECDFVPSIGLWRDLFSFGKSVFITLWFSVEISTWVTVDIAISIPRSVGRQ